MKAKTKVLFLIPSLTQGGAERQILAVMGELPERFAVDLCAFDDDVHYRGVLPAGQPRYTLGGQRIGIRSFRRLVEILRRERPDIVHSYLDNANFWGRLAAVVARRVPVVITSVRARMMEPRFLAVERLLSARSQRIVVNSRGIKDELVQLAQVSADKIRVIHNVLDLETFRPPSPAERRAARQRWGLSGSTRVLLMPGRISMQKHQLGLLLAFEAYLARRAAIGGDPGDCSGDNRDVVLMLPGRGRDAFVDRRVARVAERPLLRGRVRLLGAQEDIRSLYWAADVLVLTSLWEGLPNAALEGCACGLPALLSEAANLDEIIVPGQSGWQVPTANKRAITAALSALLGCDRATLSALGASARRRVEARFDPRRIRQEMVQMYDDLLAETRTAARGAVCCAGGI